MNMIRKNHETIKYLVLAWEISFYIKRNDRILLKMNGKFHLQRLNRTKKFFGNSLKGNVHI